MTLSPSGLVCTMEITFSLQVIRKTKKNKLKKKKGSCMCQISKCAIVEDELEVRNIHYNILTSQ